MPKNQSFDNYYEDYDNWFIKNENIYKNEIEIIKSFLPLNSFGLEIGVGTGKFSIPFNIKIGIDPSYYMAIKAKRQGINVILAVSESLPFKNNIFDFVLIVTSICFFDDVQKSLNEAYRVLKKNGNIIIGFVDANSNLGKRYSLNKESSKFYKNAEFYSVEILTDYLRKAKFIKYEYKQALFDDSSTTDIFKPGYGEGSFIAIKAKKT